MLHVYTDEIGGTNANMVSRSVCRALTIEFETFRKRMRGGIIKGGKDESLRTVKFGPESFELGIKTWRQIFMSQLLLWTLFGSDCSFFMIGNIGKWGWALDDGNFTM